MIKQLHNKFPIEPLIEQINKLDLSNKRIDLNKPTGKFFNDPWVHEFQGTPLGDLLDSLGPIGQARLLTLYAGDTYTAHCDPDDRYHFAFSTNKYSFLVDLDSKKFYTVPVDGHVYHMDTSITHIAVNWGPTVRTHLNVRLLLPKFDETKPGLKIKVNQGKVEWKQDSYIEIMGFVNKSIKAGVVTGFDAPNETTLYLNCMEPRLFDDIIDRIRNKGVDVSVDVF